MCACDPIAAGQIAGFEVPTPQARPTGIADGDGNQPAALHEGQREDAADRGKGGNGTKQPELKFERDPPDDIAPGKAVWEVFAHWKEIFGRTDAQLDGPRGSVIKRALGWRRKATGGTRQQAVDDVKAALTAAMTDRWVQGENRSGEPIVELATLLGSTAVFERLMAAALGQEYVGGEHVDGDGDSLYPVLNAGDKS